MKKSFSKEYDSKDFGKVKTIIGQQISQDIETKTMKINQSVFIQDLVIKKNPIKCNANVIPMKTGSIIKMTKPKNDKNADFCMYQQLIDKLIYLECGTRPNITFVIG